MSDLRKIVEKAKSQGFISYLDVIKYLPPDIVEQDQIEDILSMLSDMGIEVRKDKAEVISISKGSDNE